MSTNVKKEHKEFIDNASYEELLKNWRFCPSGDPLFQGETGDYYMKVMNEKKNNLSPDEQVTVSKNIGWG